METETRLAEYVVHTKFEDLPKEPLDVIKNVVLTVLGTTMAGANAAGCKEVARLVKKWGGRREATLLIHGGKLPAYNAAFANTVMARARDFCDAMFPGIHIGASSVPTALAAAELGGGCSGKEFLTALAVGTEVASRLNAVSAYDGFDPSGVCTIFATTAIAGRLLHLNPEQMLNALGIAFNRAGGSFQSQVDGSLATRMVQGFSSQGGMMSAQMAQAGITGPRNFLEGIHGYFHLFAKDQGDPRVVAGELGKRFELLKTIFKKYPSSGGTATSTDAILDVISRENIEAEDVAEVNIRVTPHLHKLAGHQFEIGDNPTVNAQFNIQYCVANALLRKSSKLEHFDARYVTDPRIMELARRVHTQPDAEMELRGGTAVDMEVRTRQGIVYHRALGSFKGEPGNPLSPEEHRERFRGCVDYSGGILPGENVEKIIALVQRMEDVEDVRTLIPLLVSNKGRVAVR